MKCEICGSNDIVKQDGIYICQHCGTKYTVEEARKLIGVVKIDKSEENEKYLILARRARDEENPQNAIKYYSLVAENDPQNWEPVLYVPYFQFVNNPTHDTSAAFRRALENACQMIEQQVPPNERGPIAQSIYRLALKGGIHARANNAIYDFMGVARDELRTCFNRNDLADSVDAEYSDHKRRDQEAFDMQMDQFRREGARLQRETRALRGGCYIATCVYGSYDCPQVWTLRRFRDNTLAATWYGRAFIRAYYAISPKMVRWFGNTAWFKHVWHKRLDKLVLRLRKQGVADTPYHDRSVFRQ